MNLVKCKHCGLIYKPNGEKPICPKCESSHNEKINDMKKVKQEGIKSRIRRKLKVEKVEILRSNPSIHKDKSKCINCGLCAEVCRKQRVYGTYTRLSTPVCVNCGKCTLTCPTYSLTEKLSFRKVRNLIGKKLVAISIAPGVKVSFKEEFNFEFSEKQLVTALKKLGFDYVFNISTGADVTIMEEAKELVERIKTKKLPMFTSCCPSWVKYAEIYTPEILPSLSTTKSPISIQSALIKTYFNEKLNKEVVHVVVAPCTAKKFEITRKELVPTTDFILTTRELALFMKTQGIDISICEESEYDEPFGESSKSGENFAGSGGVSSSVLKTAYYLLNNKPADEKEFEKLINTQNMQLITLPFGKQKLKVVKVYGLDAASDLLKQIHNKTIEVDFVEVMACENGCIGGGGQPKKQKDLLKRFDNLKTKNDIIKLKEPYNSSFINKLYEVLKNKTDDEIKNLLHTKYKSREKEYILKKEKIMELKGSKTEKNLMEAFAGESQARNKYTFYASQAKKDGFEEIASIFEETANNEKEHAKLWFKALHNGIPQTLDNLLDAAAGEYAEWTDMYKRMAQEAREEGFTKLAEQFEGVAAIEKVHEERFRKLAEQVKANNVFESEDVVVWKCRNCGHIHVGTKAPNVCPVCVHPQAYFEIVK